MKQSESINSIIKDVEKKKEDIALKSTEILTLQHQNVVLLEQTYIQRDKLFMLETEFQDRKRIFENLYIKYKKKNQNMVEEEFEEGDIDESVIGQRKKAKTNIKVEQKINEDDDEDREKKNQPDISDLRVLEGIQNYLDKQMHKHDKYRMMKQLNFSPTKNKHGEHDHDDESSSESESDEGSEDGSLIQQEKKNKKQNKQIFNPFTCIQVRYKVVKQNDIADGQKVVISFRVEEKTKFQEIKRAACQYWHVKDPNSREVNGVLTQTISKDENYSFMDLCDETNSTLPDSQYVIQFLMQKGYKNLNQCTLILRPKEFRTALESQQNECTKITKGTDQQKTQGQYYVQRIQVNQINPYDYFFQEYPSLKFYIEQKRLQDTDQSSEQNTSSLTLTKGFSDSHCCIITFIIMIITVTALFLSKMIDVEIKHETQRYFTRVLQLGNKFENYSKEQLLSDFFTDIIGNCFFDSTISVPKQAFFKDSFEIIGNLRIRFQRQKLKQCDIYYNKYTKNSCFDFDNIDLDKSDIGFGDSFKYQFQKFQNGPSSDKQRFNLKGTYGVYSPEGFMLDFGDNVTREQYRYQVEYLSYILATDNNLRVLILTFTLYNPSLDLWKGIVLVLSHPINLRFTFLSQICKNIHIYIYKYYHKELKSFPLYFQNLLFELYSLCISVILQFN